MYRISICERHKAKEINTGADVTRAIRIIYERDVSRRYMYECVCLQK